MSEISAAIAAAVEEQGAATQEIARNVQEAARGAAQVSANIGDVRHGAEQTERPRRCTVGARPCRREPHLRESVQSFLARLQAA